MDYRLSHAFSIDAAGAPVPGMEAAARFYRARDHAAAERCCLDVLQLEPRHFDALHLLGVVHLDLSRPQMALDYLTRAAAERPSDPQVRYHLGNALQALGNAEAAAAQFRATLQGNEAHVDALNNLGNALGTLGRHAEAIDCYRRAVRVRPDFSPALYNLGRALIALDRLEEAVGSFRAALAGTAAGAPERLADIYAALGQALVGLGQHQEALAACDALARLSSPVADWNASLVLLLLGEFAEGWRRYEGRWSVPDHDPPHKDARIPSLAEVAGRHVLLLCEQGHGDMIQFARYAPLLARNGARVTLQTYAELQALMRTLPELDAVITDKEPEPPVDIVTPLLSLPLVFGTKLGSIPAEVPYLHAPPERLMKWQQRIGPHSQTRVGLCWWGSQHIPKRSIAIEQLQPLLHRAGLEFHALQKEIPPDQLAWMRRHAPVIDHSADLHDFADTAALITQMDLVVTIDTAVAHLAGALGKPVWIMLHADADWRWLLDRTDSPWYPTARLFRQRRRGDWTDVVVDVMQALDQRPTA